MDDGSRYLLSLGSTVTEPEQFTWREWLDRLSVEPDDEERLREFLLDQGWLVDGDPLETLIPSLDGEVSGSIVENYIEGTWAMYDSPQADAYHYLTGLDLGNSRTSEGECLGELPFYSGPMPGSNWTWVETQERLVLPALQLQLLELGEDVKVVVTE